jgi:hypothetical protein
VLWMKPEHCPGNLGSKLRKHKGTTVCWPLCCVPVFESLRSSWTLKYNWIQGEEEQPQCRKIRRLRGWKQKLVGL